MSQSGERTPLANASSSGTSEAPGWRETLHKLNNIFASIHSSLDLALVNEGRPEAKPFLETAQAAARKGAQLVAQLRANRESLPATARGAEANHPAETKSQPPIDAKGLEGSESILIAEDDEALRMLLQAILSYRGYRVGLAEDGERAVKLYQEQGPFDLVILDLRMPKLDGQGALKKIRAINPRACALALTGMPLDSADESIFKDFNGQMSKPFHSLELVAQVRRLLDGHTGQSAG